MQAEGGGHNVFMVGGCQLVTARPVDKGEQLLLNYGRKDNNAFLLSYGHLDDRMVFGNAAHRVSEGRLAGWIEGLHLIP